MDEQTMNMQGDGRGLVVTGTIILNKACVLARHNSNAANVQTTHLKVHVRIFDGDLHGQDLGGGVILQEEGQVSQ